MKKHCSPIYLCSLLLLIFIHPCYAQTDGHLFHDAIKDKAGNLWFATTGAGVYRYDAVTNLFTNFTERDGLCANNVFCIFEDRGGNIWFGTQYGVCLYDPSAGSATSGKSFTSITPKENQYHDVNCITEDRNGNFWFATNEYGVWRYDPRLNDSTGGNRNGQAASGAFTHFTKEQGLGSNCVQYILEDKAGNLWFGERAGGVCRFDSASGRFNKVDGGDCFSSQIMRIIQDKAGNIWFANLYDGLCRYDPSAKLSTGAKSFTHITAKNGLCHDFVTSLYEDKAGNLWFGSEAGRWGTGGGGLCRYDPTTGASTRFTEKDGLTNIAVRCVVEDNDGNIWVGTKGGLFRYHAPSGKFIDYTYKVNSN